MRAPATLEVRDGVGPRHTFTEHHSKQIFMIAQESVTDHTIFDRRFLVQLPCAIWNHHYKHGGDEGPLHCKVLP